MNKKQILYSLNKELNAIPIPNVIENVRKKSQLMPVTTDVTENNSMAVTKKHFSKRVFAGMMASVFLFLALSFALFPLWSANNYTTLSIDINPSLTIVLDENEKVYEVTAINEDANTLLNGLSILGNSLDVTLSMLLEKAVMDGFLMEENENAILFSVQNNRKTIKNKIKENVQTKVNNYFSQHGMNGNIIFEDYDKDLEEELKELEEKFNTNTHMSNAKYQIVKRILNRFPELIGSEEYLAQMSVLELTRLLNEQQNGGAGQNMIDQILQNILDQFQNGNRR